jgi:hypothetical protein
MRMLHCACIGGAIAVLSPLALYPALRVGGEPEAAPGMSSVAETAVVESRVPDAHARAHRLSHLPGAKVVLASLEEERANLQWVFTAFAREVADPMPLGSLAPQKVASADADAMPVLKVAAFAEPAPATKPVFRLGPHAAAFAEPTPDTYFSPAPIGPSKPIVVASLGLIPMSPALADLGPTPEKHDFSYLAYYAYSETPPPEKPADTVLNALKDIPEGSVLDEIRRAAEAFGLDYGYLKAVAKIESDFDPKQRTGSYVGLYQLSKYEFNRYGDGNILDARDNAIAAAYKIIIEAELFELRTHKKPTLSDLYLIHQQGIQGAEEHVGHPDRIAWQSMCATEEGQQKGEKWCKRAIWANTLPEVKKVWKSVDNLTSAAFVDMWAQRVTSLFTRYSATADAAPADKTNK